MEKRNYEEPFVELVYLPDEDVLTLSTPDHTLRHVLTDKDSADNTIALPSTELGQTVYD